MLSGTHEGGLAVTRRSLYIHLIEHFIFIQGKPCVSTFGDVYVFRSVKEFKAPLWGETFQNLNPRMHSQ